MHHSVTARLQTASSLLLTVLIQTYTVWLVQTASHMMLPPTELESVYYICVCALCGCVSHLPVSHLWQWLWCTVASCSGHYSSEPQSAGCRGWRSVAWGWSEPPPSGSGSGWPAQFSRWWLIGWLTQCFQVLVGSRTGSVLSLWPRVEWQQLLLWLLHWPAEAGGPLSTQKLPWQPVLWVTSSKDEKRWWSLMTLVDVT